MDRKPPSLRERRLVGRFVRTLFLRDRRGKGWPVPDWLPHERTRFEGNTGAQIDGRWFPASQPRGTVVLAHPDRRYGQHWFIVSGWIDVLHEEGYNVLTFDFADYGESRGGSTYYFEDVIAAANHARAKSPDVPVHLVGVSLGAYSAANAAPHLDFIESIVLESPYPTFNAWYGKGPGRWAMGAFDWMFPRSAALIRAPENLGRSTARRILVVASRGDTVTNVDLSRQVAAGGDPARTTYLEFDGAQHLELWPHKPEYRTAVIRTLRGEPIDVHREASLAIASNGPSRARRTAPLSIPSRTS